MANVSNKKLMPGQGSKKIIWVEKYRVGVKEFDDQHKIIFNLINQLSEMKNLTVRSERLTAALTKMTDYFWVHINIEEKYMEDYGYPEYKKHVIQHARFKKKIMKLNMDQMAHKDSVPDDLLTFLIEWWSNHRLKVDMRYRTFFNEKGLY